MITVADLAPDNEERNGDDYPYFNNNHKHLQSSATWPNPAEPSHS